MNYIDLFAGAGGMSLGFEKAGFKNIFSIEYDENIAKTYSYNFPNNNLIIKDISDLTKEEIHKIIDNKSIDVVIGGPPCQGFSMAGNIGRTFVNDPRNKLFKEFVRVVSIVKPKFFVMENVARLKIHNKGKTIKEIVNSFSEIGYTVKYEVLQSAKFNVPQFRQRIFIIGSLNIPFEFPKEKKGMISIKDAIDNLPKLSSGEKSSIPNHFAMNHTEQMLYKMSFIQDGGNREQIPEKIRPRSGDARKYIKYNSKRPSVTITGDMRKVFHYSQNRALSQRELARIQSFPDDFIFKGTSSIIQQQIGNAVPPKLSYYVANEIKRSLNKSE